MTDAEKAEHEKLLVGWAARKLSKGKMLRCLALTRQAEAEAMVAGLAITRAYVDEPREVGECPYCGRLTFVDEIEPPADYCHHETAPPA